jgi:hypothetical protein
VLGSPIEHSLPPVLHEVRDGDLLVSTVPAGAADFTPNGPGIPAPPPPQSAPPARPN